jgi:hypothetical protein
MPDRLPAVAGGFPSRIEREVSKALARQMSATGLELIAVDHAVLVERAKVRGLGHVVRDAVDEVGQIADDVVACAERNRLAGQLAAEVAVGARRAISVVRSFSRCWQSCQS